MSPEWVTAVGGLLLGAAKFSYDVWNNHRPRKRREEELPPENKDEPPAAAA